jgi:hypothetical protein
VGWAAEEERRGKKIKEKEGIKKGEGKRRVSRKNKKKRKPYSGNIFSFFII